MGQAGKLQAVWRMTKSNAYSYFSITHTDNPTHIQAHTAAPCSSAATKPYGWLVKATAFTFSLSFLCSPSHFIFAPSTSPSSKVLCYFSFSFVSTILFIFFPQTCGLIKTKSPNSSPQLFFPPNILKILYKSFVSKETNTYARWQIKKITAKPQ